MLVVEQPGEGLWGAQQYLLRLAPLLEAKGYDQVLAAPESSAVARAWRQQGRPHVHFPVPPERKIRRHGDRGPFSPLLLTRELARTAANAHRIAALGSALQVDCIHANAHWSHLEAALGGRLARLPVVLHLHDLLPGVAGRLRAAAVRVADVSVAVSNPVVGCLPERARSRVTVIHNGVDPMALSPGPAQPDIRRELARDPSAPIVLAMCRLDPRKGVDQIIRAVAALDGDLGRAQLAIVGTSSTGEGLARRLRLLGAELLGDRVRFLGPRQEIAAVLRSADVLVQASSREALGLSVLEAQACGTPVVAYPASGTSEIVRDGETGLLARQDDVAHLSACIGRVLTDAGLRAHLAGAARAQVVTTFTLERQADRQVRLLDELLAGRRDRRLQTRAAVQQEFTA
ncbi:MAG TPA: glycosyltransferase family 4 protein [Acidimicrobiales bacterium]|nr:glycosyltransferase family 4 protein [Acidimicrobiales bacterium]